ncbi:hypothetical protein F5Y12DRAFT_262278 [Xylaria sp. FL1777]|nr:hypothetical protein F5Y12DRAFT_262278 [Xylaria sp. FL1777]
MTEILGALYMPTITQESSRTNAGIAVRRTRIHTDTHTHAYIHAHTHHSHINSSQWQDHKPQLAVLLDALSTRCICTHVETAAQNIPPVVVGIAIRRTGPRWERRRRPRCTTTQSRQSNMTPAGGWSRTLLLPLSWASWTR